MLHDDGIIDPRDTRKVLIFLLQTIYEAQQRELESNPIWCIEILIFTSLILAFSLEREGIPSPFG